LRFTEGSLAETLDGGQCFRWYAEPLDKGRLWTGCFGEHLIQVKLAPGETDDLRPLQWRCIEENNTDTRESVRAYFAAETSLERLVDQIPWRGDAHLRRCIESFPGLRILRQPIGEALLCFLCSSTKQIVQIKQIVAELAERFGEPLANRWHTLPTWEKLASVSEKALRQCRLGYRARFIHETAQYLRDRPGFLAAVEAAPYPAAHAALQELPGVGAKVADCVLLFGAGKMEAFPVDTWVLKVMERRYALQGWKPPQMAHFGRVHFQPAPGLAQQYLFSAERKWEKLTAQG